MDRALGQLSCWALWRALHGMTARRAHPKCASSVKQMPPSATAEAVGITAGQHSGCKGHGSFEP
eukprot:988401-Prymnesium_polylepis.1